MKIENMLRNVGNVKYNMFDPVILKPEIQLEEQNSWIFEFDNNEVSKRTKVGS